MNRIYLLGLLLLAGVGLAACGEAAPVDPNLPTINSSNVVLVIFVGAMALTWIIGAIGKARARANRAKLPAAEQERLAQLDDLDD